MVQQHSGVKYTKKTIKSKRYIYTDDDTVMSEMKEDLAIDLYRVQQI